MIAGMLWGVFQNNVMRMTLFAVNFMLHSTLIIAACLLACFIFRNRHAVFHAFLLRTCLVAVMLSPLLSLFIDAPGMHWLSLPSPRQAAVVENSTPIHPLPRKTVGAPTVNTQSQDQAARPVKPAVTPPPVEKQPVSGAVVPLAESARHSEKSAATAISKRAPIQSGHGTVWTPVVYTGMLLLWLALSLYLLIKTILSYLMLLKIRQSACPAKSEYRETCREAAQSMGIDEIPVMQSSYVTDIFLGGVRRPAIYLPLNGNESAIVSKEVFLHELTHYVRHDNYWNVACSIGKIILPLQPLMWLLTNRIRITGDFICDDFVVSHQRDNHTYAVQMYTIASLYKKAAPRVVTATGLASGKSSIAHRVKRILDTNIPRDFRLRVREIVSTAFLYFCAFVLTGFASFKADNSRKSVAAPTDNTMAKVPSVPENLRRPESRNALTRTGVDTDKSSNMADSGADTRIMEYTPASDSGGGTSPVISVADRQNASGIEENDNKRQLLPPESDIVAIELDFSTLDTTADLTADFAASLASETVVGPASLQKESAFTTDNDTKETFEGNSDMLVTEIREQDDTAGNVIMNGFRTLASISTEQETETNAALKALKVAIPSDYEIGDMTSSEREKMSEIYRSLRNSMKYPVWSPDGSTIAFNDSDYGVWIVDVNGGEPRLVYDNYYKLIYKNYSLHIGDLKTLGFSPDGSMIAVRRYEINSDWGSSVVFDYSGPVMVYNVDKPLPVIIGKNIYTKEERILAEGAVEGSWSPDGTFFAYILDNVETERELWLLNLATEERIRMDCCNPSNVCFTKDGANVLVSEQHDGMRSVIRRLAIDSGDSEIVFQDANTVVTDISPDGRWLLYNDMTADSHQILYDTLSREIVDIAPTSRNSAGWGTFSPDGSKICFNMKSNSERWSVYTCDVAAYKSAGNDDAGASKTAIPEISAIKCNMPNPFNMETTIEFSLAENCETSLVIYNSIGQVVRELVSGILPAGSRKAVWDGRDNSGNTVSAGMYIARLRAGGRNSTLKMTVMK